MYKWDIEYDNFRTILKSMNDKWLFDMMEDIFEEIKFRSNNL